MSSFTKLAANRFDAQVTAEYEIQDFMMGGKYPVLTVRPATSDNKGFLNESLKSTTKKTIRKGKLNAYMVERMRDEDRKLYAKHVLVGWKNVINDDGEHAPFSAENALAFLEAIDNHTFEDLRDFCREPENFGSEEFDTEELVGNSSTE